jgi:hypothetical protein
MTIQVEIEGRGVVAEFPDETDPKIIDMAIQRDFFPNKQRGMTPQPRQPQSIPRRIAGQVAPYLPMAGMVGGAVLAAPVNLVAPGVAEAAGAGLGYLAGKQGEKLLQGYAQNQPLPTGGQMAKQAVQQTPEAATIGMAGPVMGKVTEVGLNTAAKGLDAISKRMYESILKIPPRAVPTYLRNKAVMAGLEGQYTATRGGFAKLSDDIIAVNQKIADQVAKNPEDRINVQVILNRIEELKQMYKGTANFRQIADNINFLRNSWLEQYMKDGSFEMTGQQAQDAKLAIHRLFKQKYGKTNVQWSHEEFQTNEAIAKGLRQELTRIYPELAQLNAKDSAMLELQKALSGSVNRTRNWDVVGLVDLIGGSLGALAGRKEEGPYGEYGGALTGLMVTRALRSPYVMSRLAFALSKVARARLGPALPSLTWGETALSGPAAEALPIPASQMPAQPQIVRGPQTLGEMYPQAALPPGSPRLGLPPPSQIQMYGPGVSWVRRRP